MNSLQFNRHRRLRQSGGMRALVRETFLHTEDFIYPIFVLEGENVRNEVPSMPGVYQISLDLLQAEMQEVVDLGIRSVIVFGLPAEKMKLDHQHIVIMELCNVRFSKLKVNSLI